MTGNKTRSRRRPILNGLAVVGLAAAVLSFETLDKLGKDIGYTATGTLDLPFNTHLTLYLSWLLPISIDVFGLLATVAWLTPAFPPEVRDYAKRVALGDIIGSAVLNALYHGMKAAEWDISECVPVVIGVGAIAPVVVALSLHLGALVMDHDPDTSHDTEGDTGPAIEATPEHDSGHDTAPASDATSDPTTGPPRKPTPRPAKKVTSGTTSTADRVAKLRAKQPDITQAEVAAKLATSVRTVQRNWGPDTQPDTSNVTPINKEATQ